MPFGYYLRSQVTPFIVLFIERDGSTFLISMLDSHGQVQTVYERFAVLKQRGSGAGDQLAWASSFFSPPRIGKFKAVGFKTKLVDVLDIEGFARLLQEKQCRVIHMQRHNRVKAVISRINARRLWEATGKWNLYKESDRLPPNNIDPQVFKEFLQEREESDRILDEFVATLGLPSVTICYEDLLTDREKALGKVFELLRVEPKSLTEKTKKHTSDDLREVVVNFDELKADYIGTEYEPMFDEVLIPPNVAESGE